MNGLILAAGRGSRLGHLTDDRPKCMVALRGRPLLQWQLDAMRCGGVDAFAMVRGYRWQQLKFSGIRAFDNARWAETNMVASLACATDWLRSGPCIVSYADIVCHPDHISRLAACDADIAITYDTQWLSLWQARFADPLCDAETLAVGGDGALTDIGRRPSSLDQVAGQYMGLLKTTPAGWRCVERHLASLSDSKVDALDMTSLLQALIAEGVSIAAVPVAGRWLEIDSSSDLRLYSRWLDHPHASDWLGVEPAQIAS